MADKDKIEKIISMGTEVDTSNGEKQLNDFINENRTIRFSVEPTKSSISASYRTIKDELKNKPPIYFNVAIRKSSINQAMSDLRDEIAIRDETIEQLQSNIKQMEVEHQRRIQEVKQSYEVEHRKQSEYIDKILRYFPYVEKLMPMIKYLSEKNGFQ